MARYSQAIWRPLPEASREPLITATQVILHTAVSGASSLYGYFARDDVGVESHFYVNKSGVEQYVDTSRQADANLDANVRAISIESWDGGDPEHTPWTPHQLDLLAELLDWCCRTHGIPVRQCPAWDAPGVGWHSMWGAPSHWTPVAGKTCPGGPRIAQVPDLIARVAAGQLPEEDILTEQEHAMLADINHRTGDHTNKINGIKVDVDGLQADMVALRQDVAEIKALLAPPAPPEEG